MKGKIIIDKEKIIAFRPKGLDVYSQEYVEEIDVIENTKKVEQVPENIEDVKEILEESKIKHELFYVNDKDYRWTINDKVKILRAIVIRFKTKFDDVYTEYSVTIDNDNRIVIHKYKYEGSESITMKLSTMEQIWNMFANIYKDVLGE